MGLFGLTLPDSGPLPDIFDLCLNHLELHALEVEGIFRISGQKLRIDELKREFETGKRYEFRESDDVHDVAGLFRLWLHSLPEPIVPHEYYGKLIECGKMERKKARTPLKELADKLPPLRRLMLQRLIRLLRLLSLYCETNKMTANNLAVVMGPNICRPEKMEMTVEALAEAQCVTNAVITLIMDYEFILPREPPNSDKHLAHVKRKSRVDNFMVPGINLPKAGSEADSITSVKEAEDAIDSKLSLSLSELKPDVAMAEPMSARGPARSRQRGPSSARNRGFSNALEWLVTSVQEDTLEDVISSDLPALPEESAANDSSLMSSSGSSGTNSGTTGVSSLSPSNSATLKSRRRMSKKAKTANDGSTQPESPREVSTASTSTNGSESASLQLNLSAGRRSKKLRSESSGNSTSADTASSTSEPPSPREGKSSSSGHKKKKSNKSSASASGDSPRRDPSADEENVGVPSPRRRIAPPSRESSVN